MMDEGIELMRRLFTERACDARRQYYAVRDLEMYPKPRLIRSRCGWRPQSGDGRARGTLGHRLAARLAPWPELEARIKAVKGAPPSLGGAIQPASRSRRISLTVAKTAEEPNAGMASGLVAHRKSPPIPAATSKQVTANLVGSPDLILEKIDGLKKIGVDHACCALMIPADGMAEFEDQLEWFAKVAL